MKTQIISTISVSCSLFFVHSAIGQGVLTPPGPPAPTMKTLAQIEPRTAITNTGAVTISQPGSFYLITNITVGAGNAVTISANNVTLDLNGFTLVSTNPSASGYGILLAGGRTNITIFNGHILGSVTQSGGVYNGAGFDTGIGDAGAPHNVRVVGVTVSSCLSSGIYLDAIGTVVDSCAVDTVGYVGIYAQTVSDSSALNCGAIGVDALTVQNCFGTSAGVDGTGLYAAFSANNCYGAATSSGSSDNNSYGLYAVNAINCCGVSVNGYGLYAGNSANNCSGSSTPGTGLYAHYTADNCYGTSTNNIGLFTDSAQNCYGFSAGNSFAYGIYATMALSCHGYGSAGADAISASVAQNCYGFSVNGAGIYTTTAQNCYGSSTTFLGITASTALNCYASSGSSSFSALNVPGGVANNSIGYNSGGGPAITTCIAIGCVSISGPINASCSKWLGTP